MPDQEQPNPNQPRGPHDGPDTDLSNASGPAEVRKRVEPTHRELILDGANRAIVALEALPLLSQFFGAALVSSPREMPHGISVGALPVKPSGAPIQSGDPQNGAEIFSTKESVVDFLREQAQKIEEASPGARQQIFRGACESVAKALHEVKYRLQLGAEPGFSFRQEPGFAVALRTYLSKAYELHQILADGDPRKHLDGFSALLRDVQQRIGLDFVIGPEQERVPVDTRGAERLPPALQLSYGRLLHGARRFLSFPTSNSVFSMAKTGVFGDAFPDSGPTRVEPLTDFEKQEVVQELRRSGIDSRREQIGDRQVYETGEFAPDYVEHRLAPASRLITLLKSAVDKSHRWKRFVRSNPQQELRALTEGTRDLCIDIDDEATDTRATSRGNNFAEVRALLYTALERMEGIDQSSRSLRGFSVLSWVRDEKWYGDLLTLLGQSFGDTLLEGCKRSRLDLPDFARGTTALIPDSQVLAELFFQVHTPLNEAEISFFSRLSGLLPQDLQKLHGTWSNVLERPTYLRSVPPELGDLLDPLPGARDYKPMRVLEHEELQRFKALGIEASPSALQDMARLSEQELEGLARRAENLIKEVGLDPYTVSNAFEDKDGPIEGIAHLEGRITYVGEGSERVPASGSFPRVIKALKALMGKEDRLSGTGAGIGIQSIEIFASARYRTSLRTFLENPGSMSPRDLVHAALIVELTDKHFAQSLEDRFASWRPHLPVQSFTEVLTHADTAVREAGFSILHGNQIVPLLEWLRLSPPETFREVIEDGVAFARIGPKSGNERSVDPVLFNQFLVGYLIARFERFPTAIPTSEFQRELQRCKDEAKARTRQVSDPSDITEVSAALSNLGFGGAGYSQYQTGFHALEALPESQALSSAEEMCYARLLGQLPRHFSFDDWSQETIATLRACSIRPDVLAQSGVLVVLTAGDLIISQEDLKATLKALEGLVAKGSAALMLSCATSLLQVARVSDREGYFSQGRLTANLKDTRERRKTFGEFFRGEMDPTRSAALKTYLQKSSFGLGALRMAVAEGSSATWDNSFGPFSPEEFGELATALRQRSGAVKEIETIKLFIDAYRAVKTEYLYSVYRSIKLNHSYCPTELTVSRSDIWRSWPDYLFPLHSQAGQRMFPDERSLAEYVWNQTESFTRNPSRFSPKLILDFELAAVASRLYRTDELSSAECLQQVKVMLEPGREFVNAGGVRSVPVPKSPSAFDVFREMPSREVTVPRFKSNPRDLKLEGVPGPFALDARQQFEADSAVLYGVVERGVPSILSELSTRIGPLALGGSDAEAHGAALQPHFMALADHLVSQPLESISDDDLRLMFYAHAARDRRSLGSAIRMSEYSEFVERVTGFVEFVGTGSKDPEWLDVLARCTPELRARFERISDVEYLLAPLTNLIRSDGPATQPSSQTSAGGSTKKGQKEKGGAEADLKVRLQLHRDAPIHVVGHICDSCVRDSLESHPTKAFVTFTEPGRGTLPIGTTFSGGFMLFQTTTEEGKKALVIRGYNPTATLVHKVAISKLFDEVVRYIAEEIAPKVGATEILAPLDTIPGMAFSNRAFAYLAFKLKYKDAPRVSVPDERVIFNRYDIRERCVKVWVG